MADFLADTGSLLPESLIPSECTLFGLVMNTERIVHRISRRRLAEVAVVTSGQGVPFELFRAAAYSVDQATLEYERHNITLERLARALSSDS